MGSPANRTKMFEPAFVTELAPERGVVAVAVASATILDLGRGLGDELPFVLRDPRVAGDLLRRLLLFVLLLRGATARASGPVIVQRRWRWSHPRQPSPGICLHPPRPV